MKEYNAQAIFYDVKNIAFFAIPQFEDKWEVINPS